MPVEVLRAAGLPAIGVDRAVTSPDGDRKILDVPFELDVRRAQAVGMFENKD